MQRLRAAMCGVERVVAQLQALGALLAAHSTGKDDFLALNSGNKETTPAVPAPVWDCIFRTGFCVGVALVGCVCMTL